LDVEIRGWRLKLGIRFLLFSGVLFLVVLDFDVKLPPVGYQVLSLMKCAADAPLIQKTTKADKNIEGSG